MKQKLAELQKNLPWIERLDLVNTPAPLAPEMAYKEDLHGKERSNKLQQEKAGVSLEDDVVHNDFKREMLFYRHHPDHHQPQVPGHDSVLQQRQVPHCLEVDQGRRWQLRSPSKETSRSQPLHI